MVFETVPSMTLNCSSHTLPCLGAYYAGSQRYRTLLYRTVVSYCKFMLNLLCNITNTYEQIMNTEQYRMICSFFRHFCLSVYTHNLPCDIEKSVAILDYTPIFKILYKNPQSFFIKKCSVHNLLIYLFVYFYYIFYYTFLYIFI